MLHGQGVQETAGRTAGTGSRGSPLILRGTSERRAGHCKVLLTAICNCDAAHDGIDSRVHERSDGHRSVDGDAVFEIGDDTEIAAGESDLIHRNGNGYRGPAADSSGYLRTGVPSGLVKSDRADAGQESHRRDRANIETAKIVFAAHIGALEWRGDQSAEAGDKRSLNVEAESVAPVLHRNKSVCIARWAEPSERCRPCPAISAPKVNLLPVMRGDRAVDGVEREVGEDLAGDNSLQGVGPGNAAEGDELKQVLGCELKRQQRGAVK